MRVAPSAVGGRATMAGAAGDAASNRFFVCARRYLQKETDGHAMGSILLRGSRYEEWLGYGSRG